MLGLKRELQGCMSTRLSLWPQLNRREGGQRNGWLQCLNLTSSGFRSGLLPGEERGRMNFQGGLRVLHLRFKIILEQTRRLHRARHR
jgi:hypothetical protein